MNNPIHPTSSVNLLDKNVTKMASILNTTDNDKRVAAYMGIATYMVSVFLPRTTGNVEIPANFKVSSKNFLYRINEVAIIDMELLESIVNKMAKLKLGVMHADNVLNTFAISKFDDLLGVNQTIGQSFVESMEKEIKTFRDALYTVSKLNMV